VSPADLTTQDQKEIQYFVERVLDALGVEFGATHTEIVLGEAGPRVIETHIRMGGDEIPALAFDATGVDLADCVVRQTVGAKVLSDIRTVLAENRSARSSAIWLLAAPAAGELVDITGLDEAGETEGVTEVKLLVRPGSVVGNLESSDSRIAYVRAVGKTPEQAVNSARKAATHLEFQLRVRDVSEKTV
jgi:biotin carboxylase